MFLKSLRHGSENQAPWWCQRPPWWCQKTQNDEGPKAAPVGRSFFVCFWRSCYVVDVLLVCNLDCFVGVLRNLFGVILEVIWEICVVGFCMKEVEAGWTKHVSSCMGTTAWIVLIQRSLPPNCYMSCSEALNRSWKHRDGKNTWNQRECCSLSSASGLLLGGCYSTSCGHVRFKASNLIILKWSWLTQIYCLNFKPHTWSLKKTPTNPRSIWVCLRFCSGVSLWNSIKTLTVKWPSSHWRLGGWGVVSPPSITGETRGGPCWLESYPAYRAIAPWTVDILPSLRKGFTFVVDWGVVNRPYTHFKKTYAWLLLDRWLQCFIVNVWIIWMNDQRRLERMICCVVCFFVL